MVSGDVSLPHSNREKKLNRFDSLRQMSDINKLSLSLVCGYCSSNCLTSSLVTFIGVLFGCKGDALCIHYNAFAGQSVSRCNAYHHEGLRLPNIVLVYQLDLSSYIFLALANPALYASCCSIFSSCLKLKIRCGLISKSGYSLRMCSTKRSIGVFIFCLDYFLNLL